MRHWWTRLSSAHILVFAAGALAFVANLAVLRPSHTPPRIAVASEALLPGTRFDPSRHVELVPMDTDPALLETLLGADALDRYDGRIVSRRVEEGAVIRLDELAGGVIDGRRLMSIPVDSSRAAGGVLVVGDSVDVITVDDGTARYVTTGAEIVDLPTGKNGSFAVSTDFYVVLAVDADTALALSAIVDSGSIHLIRSTGSPEPELVRDRSAGDAP